MATLTIIVGMPGAGKTNKLSDIKNKRKDGFFVDDFMKDSTIYGDFKTSIYYQELIRNLNHDIDCVIADVQFSFEYLRNRMETLVKKECPNIEIEWLCFEKNPEACIKNIKRRNRPVSIQETEIKWIRDNEKAYTYPPAIELNDIIPIWTPAE